MLATDDMSEDSADGAVAAVIDDESAPDGETVTLSDETESATPSGGDDDASWWAAGGGEPDPADDLAVTEPVDVIAPVGEDPAFAATGAVTTTSVRTADDMPGDTTDGDLDVVAFEPTTTMPTTTTTMPITAAGASAIVASDEFEHVGARDIGDTSEMGVTESAGLFDGASDVHEYAPADEGFRLRAAFVFSVLALIATLMATVADVIDIRTTRPVDGIVVGIRTLEDFGTNLSIAGFVGAALMLIGGLLSCFGLRWGAGLAGGAGLSLTGWAAVTLGLVEAPIHAAEGVTLNASGVTAFTLSVTRDLGYFLVAAVGIIGLVVFVVSLRMAGTAGRGGLNPWIAAVGALASVVLAAGPLITLGGAPLDANFGTVGIPREFFAGRLVQLGLIVVTGVIGFLSVRTYGLGLAIGGLGVAVWMWITSLTDIPRLSGDLPVSVAVGNIGTSDTTPHAVTTVGVTASLALLLIAATVATVTRRRA